MPARMLPKNASMADRLKYKLCEKFVIYLIEHKITAHARELGAALGARLDQWKSRFDFIGDVRGLGPMRAMEFVKSTDGTPDAERVKKLVQFSYEHGVILMSAGTYGNVVRFLVPLTMSVAELNNGLDMIEAGL